MLISVGRTSTRSLHIFYAVTLLELQLYVLIIFIDLIKIRVGGKFMVKVENRNLFKDYDQMAHKVCYD
jgi:hypothetical protein